MSRRSLLSNASRQALFRIPTEPDELVRRYLLTPADHDLVRTRRRPENRLGLAVHVSLLRYPGLGWKDDSLLPAELVALDLMAQRLSTPLQFAEHLNRAFEAGLCTGQKLVTADIVEATLAPDFDDLEPRLTRQGYSVKVLAEQFHARPLEIRFHILNGQLEAGRTRELADRMRTAGLAL